MEKVCAETTFLNGKQGFWMDGYLKAALDHLRAGVEKKHDGIFVIDGMERSGKSISSFACANYLDNTFIGEEALNRITFLPRDFIAAVRIAQPKQAIIWDEAILGAMSSEYYKPVVRTIQKMLNTIGKKNLYIIINVPWIWELLKYIAVARARFLIHVYCPDGITRGTMKFFNYDEKRRLFFAGKKLHDYEVVRPSWVGNFNNYEGYFVDEKAYEKKKDNAIAEVTKEGELVSELEDYKEKMLHKDSLRIMELRKLGIPIVNIARIMHMSPNEIYAIFDTYKIPYQKFAEKQTKKVQKLVEQLQRNVGIGEENVQEDIVSI